MYQILMSLNKMQMNLKIIHCDFLDFCLVFRHSQLKSIYDKHDRLLQALKVGKPAETTVSQTLDLLTVGIKQI